jgi:hypothetical protein
MPTPLDTDTIATPHSVPLPMRPVCSSGVGYAEGKAIVMWPFPPPGGPVPWTPQQESEYQRQQRSQLPEAPF